MTAFNLSTKIWWPMGAALFSISFSLSLSPSLSLCLFNGRWQTSGKSVRKWLYIKCEEDPFHLKIAENVTLITFDLQLSDNFQLKIWRKRKRMGRKKRWSRKTTSFTESFSHLLIWSNNPKTFNFTLNESLQIWHRQLHEWTNERTNYRKIFHLENVMQLRKIIAKRIIIIYIKKKNGEQSAKRLKSWNEFWSTHQCRPWDHLWLMVDCSLW